MNSVTTSLHATAAEQLERPGYEPYTPALLRIYDPFVHGLSNRILWRCPTRRLQQLYELAGERHVEVGPGTGSLLAGARPSTLTLVDPNADVLEFAGRRLASAGPRLVRASVLSGDWPLPRHEADSVGFNYVLHCLPGPMARKVKAFDRLVTVLAPDGVLFGSTVLADGDGVHHSRLSRAVMRAYNRRGIFGNHDDTLDELRSALETRFGEVDVEVTGAVALFTARRPL